MDGLSLFIGIIIGVVGYIGIRFLLGQKSLSKKRRRTERIVKDWERIQRANKYGIRIKPKIAYVNLTDGTQPETIDVEITATWQVAGIRQPIPFTDTFIVNNNSQARYNIPSRGDEVKILYVIGSTPPVYFMERPWD